MGLVRRGTSSMCEHNSSGVGLKSTVSLFIVFAVIVALVILDMVDARSSLMDDRGDVRGHSISLPP